MSTQNRAITVEECKEIGLLVLDEIDRVCKKLNLKYFLAYGTLLGAIRHKGYIPWDDDVDIWMNRHDFKILVKEFNKNAKDGFKLIYYDNTPNYRCLFPKVTYTNTKVKEKHLSSINGTGIWVDIFVLDYIDAPSEEETNRLITLEHRRGLSLFPYADFSMKIGLICSYIFRKGTKLSDFHTPTSYFTKEITRLHANENRKQYMRSPNGLTAFNQIFNSEWFDEAISVPFEDRSYPVPKKYDEILKACYGEYMIVPSKKDQEKAKHMTDAEWI